MSTVDITNQDRFVRDFNLCAERYRDRFRNAPRYATAIFIPREATVGDARPLVERLLSWMCAEQWSALERMGAEVFVERDIRRMGTEVIVHVRHEDAQAVFDNNAYAISMVLHGGSRLDQLRALAADLEGQSISPLLFARLALPRGADPDPSLNEGNPSVHVQEPGIPASSERRLALNHKLRGKKDVTHSEHQSGKDSVDQRIARRRPRAKRTPRH